MYIYTCTRKQLLVKYLERIIKHIEKILIEGQKNRSNEENQKHDWLFLELQIKFDNLSTEGYKYNSQ